MRSFFAALSGSDIAGRASGLLEALTVPVLVFFGALFALAKPNDQLARRARAGGASPAGGRQSCGFSPVPARCSSRAPDLDGVQVFWVERAVDAGGDRVPPVASE